MKKQLTLILLSLSLICCNSTSTTEISNDEAVGAKLNTAFVDTSKVHNRAPLMISRDYGATWASASGNLPQEIQVSFLQPKGNEIVLASDNMGIFMSTGTKSNWKSIGDQLPNKK